MTDVIAAADRGRAERNPSADVSAKDAEAIRFVKAIEAGVERANRKAISGAQRIQKWIILPVDFSIPGGELGKIFFYFHSEIVWVINILIRLFLSLQVRL